MSPPLHSSLGLRLAHALLFLALASLALVGSAPEWRQLGHALARPFHTGAPPRGLALAGSVLAGLGALQVLLALALRRSAPLWASVQVLVALGLAGLAQGDAAERERSEPRANRAFLEVGRRLHLTMVDVLQRTGEVPRDEAAWSHALERAGGRGDRVRDRSFGVRAPCVVRGPSRDSLPGRLVPGQVLAWVSQDGATFELRLVGFGERGPALLADPVGGPLVLVGLFNPALSPPELAPELALEAP